MLLCSKLGAEFFRQLRTRGFTVTDERVDAFVAQRTR
jgi:hypothetical protein